MKILIAGGGNMGRTFAESFVQNHEVQKSDLFILVRSELKAANFQQDGFVNVFSSPGDWIKKCDLIILAVKPQDTMVLYNAMRPFLNPNQAVLSIMAGVKMETIALALNTQKVIRAMPNLPSQIGMGITGFTASETITRSELLAVQNLLNTTGKAIYFDNEAMLDSVTAISGSGPAYVFQFMQAMIDTAIGMGFTQNQAELLVEQTFLGAVHLLNNHNLTCNEWIAKVASKGGTTEAALKVFSAEHLSDTIANGLKAAENRARELGA